VPFARGTRCGLRECCDGDGMEMGSMSRSKMAEEEEWLGKKEKKHVIHMSSNDKSERDTHRGGRGWNGVGRPRAQSMVRCANVL